MQVIAKGTLNNEQQLVASEYTFIIKDKDYKSSENNLIVHIFPSGEQHDQLIISAEIPYDNDNRTQQSFLNLLNFLDRDVERQQSDFQNIDENHVDQLVTKITKNFENLLSDNTFNYRASIYKNSTIIATKGSGKNKHQKRKRINKNENNHENQHSKHKNKKSKKAASNVVNPKNIEPQIESKNSENDENKNLSDSDNLKNNSTSLAKSREQTLDNYPTVNENLPLPENSTNNLSISNNNITNNNTKETTNNNISDVIPKNQNQQLKDNDAFFSPFIPINLLLILNQLFTEPPFVFTQNKMPSSPPVETSPSLPDEMLSPLLDEMLSPPPVETSPSLIDETMYEELIKNVGKKLCEQVELQEKNPKKIRRISMLFPGDNGNEIAVRIDNKSEKTIHEIIENMGNDSKSQKNTTQTTMPFFNNNNNGNSSNTTVKIDNKSNESSDLKDSTKKIEYSFRCLSLKSMKSRYHPPGSLRTSTGNIENAVNKVTEEFSILVDKWEKANNGDKNKFEIKKICIENFIDTCDLKITLSTSFPICKNFIKIGMNEQPSTTPTFKTKVKDLREFINDICTAYGLKPIKFYTKTLLAPEGTQVFMKTKSQSENNEDNSHAYETWRSVVQTCIKDIESILKSPAISKIQKLLDNINTIEKCLKKLNTPIFIETKDKKKYLLIVYRIYAPWQIMISSLKQLEKIESQDNKCPNNKETLLKKVCEVVNEITNILRASSISNNVISINNNDCNNRPLTNQNLCNNQTSNSNQSSSYRNLLLFQDLPPNSYSSNNFFSNSSSTNTLVPTQTETQKNNK